MLGWLKRVLNLGGVSRASIGRRVRSPDPDERRKAAEYLGGVSEPWACDTLFVLVKDVMPEVRAAAFAALRRHGTAATGVLIQALEDGDPKVAVPAADALGDLKDLDAVRPLLLVIKFGSVEIRAAATRALIKYGRAAIPGLMLACEDRDPWTRTRGHEILTAIRAEEQGWESAATPPGERPA